MKALPVLVHPGHVEARHPPAQRAGQMRGAEVRLKVDQRWPARFRDQHVAAVSHVQMHDPPRVHFAQQALKCKEELRPLSLFDYSVEGRARDEAVRQRMRVDPERGGWNARQAVQPAQRAPLTPDQQAADGVADDGRARAEILHDPLLAVVLEHAEHGIGPAAGRDHLSAAALELLAREGLARIGLRNFLEGGQRAIHRRVSDTMWMYWTKPPAIMQRSLFGAMRDCTIQVSPDPDKGLSCTTDSGSSRYRPPIPR